MSRTTAFAAALAITLGLTAAPAVAAPADATRATLQRLLDAEHTAGMPGAYGQVRDGRRTYNLATGLADLTTNRPTRPDLRHRVGSVTKTFVATVLLQLVDEHRLRLDDPIGRYLPQLVGGPVGQQVTVRMLMNHTSGIGNYTNALLSSPQALEGLADTTYEPAQLIAIGLGMPSTNAPGARWSYSNTNYIILGQLIAKLTGRPYEQAVQRRILQPLGLRDTYLPGTELEIRGPHAAAYLRWTDGSLRDFARFSATWADSAGELVSTGADLDRFYRALFSGRLLPERLLDAMRTTVPLEADHPEYGGYGLGLMNLPLPCGTFWGHTGGVVGQATFAFSSPDGSRQVALGENMRDGWVELDPAHPINQARAEFLVTALCGPQPQNTRSATTPPTQLRPRQPDVLPTR